MGFLMTSHPSSVIIDQSFLEKINNPAKFSSANGAPCLPPYSFNNGNKAHKALLMNWFYSLLSAGLRYHNMKCLIKRFTEYFRATRPQMKKAFRIANRVGYSRGRLETTKLEVGWKQISGSMIFFFNCEILPYFKLG